MRAGAGAGLGGVFGVGDVADPVQLVSIFQWERIQAASCAGWACSAGSEVIACHSPRRHRGSTTTDSAAARLSTSTSTAAAPTRSASWSGRPPTGEDDIAGTAPGTVMKSRQPHDPFRAVPAHEPNITACRYLHPG